VSVTVGQKNFNFASKDQLTKSNHKPKELSQADLHKPVEGLFNMSRLFTAQIKLAISRSMFLSIVERDNSRCSSSRSNVM